MGNDGTESHRLFKRDSFLGMGRRQFIVNSCVDSFFLFLFSLHAAQDQSDRSGGHGGAARSIDWMGVKGQVQQEECFRGEVFPTGAL